MIPRPGPTRLATSSAFERSLIGDIEGNGTVDLTVWINMGKLSATLYVRTLLDVNGQAGKTIQCVETTCGDPNGVTAIGGKIYTYVIQPRTIGLKVGTRI